MAIVEYGPFITDMKGSIGGITFQHNASGKIARIKPKPNLSQTELQRQQHQAVNFYNIEWHKLTLVQQQAYNTYAGLNQKLDRFGKLRSITGFNWFFSINYNRQVFKYPIATTPPAYNLPTSLTTAILMVTPVAIGINLSPMWVPVNSGLYIYFTSPITTTGLNFDRQLRLVYADDPGSIGNLVLTSEWSKVWDMTWNNIYVAGGFHIGCLIIPVNQVSGNVGTPIRLIAQA